jgi:hypothetical protein
MYHELLIVATPNYHICNGVYNLCFVLEFLVDLHAKVLAFKSSTSC